MGYYDSAFKNMGNQMGYAAGTIGAFILHNFSKEKSELAKESVKEDGAARSDQIANYRSRIDSLQSAYDEQQKLLVDTNQELNNYKDATSKAMTMIQDIKGMIK